MHRAEFFWQSFAGSYQKLHDYYDVAIGYQQGLSTYFVADKVSASRKICWINGDIEASRHLKGYCRKYYAEFDNVVTPSEILLGKMAKSEFIKYPERLVCINDIINPEVIGSLSHEFTPFEKSASCVHLTTVGRLVKEKGYNLLMDAAEILRNSGVEFQWHIIGTGPLKEELGKSIADKSLNGFVILEGLQTNPYPYIANCDIYVQTSIHEGFGITVGEAKVLHKPIVCTNFPVVYDQLEDHVNGVIVGMNGVSIADGIKELLSDNSLRERLILNLRQDNNASTTTESLKLQNLILNGKSSD
ncbi:MAG: glycosyltransferase [Muribaculaceae bacterium]|nr:glycosyltransferase [Muribaculaceae bacterium]